MRRIICTTCGFGGDPKHKVTIEPKEGNKSFKITNVSCQNCSNKTLIEIKR